MARWYARDDDAPVSGSGLAMLAVGLLAGLAAGAYVADRFGGMSGISERIRRRLRSRRRLGPGAGPEAGDDGDGDALAADGYGDEYDDFDDTYDDVEADVDPQAGAAGWSDVDPEDDDADDEGAEDDDYTSADPALEDRVLEAFVNDPVLRERAVDIGAINPGTIELSGAVFTPEEYERATILARGVPGVTTVVNRLAVEEEETEEDRAAARYQSGDPRATESRWESEIIGTGRPRQGTSQDVGRHADPKVPLEERATDEQQALRQSADDPVESGSRRRRRNEPVERADGSPIAPGGVPKADHVMQDPPG